MSARITGFILIALLSASAAHGAAQVQPRYAVAFDAEAKVAQVRLCLVQAHGDVHFAADSEWAMRFVSDLRRSGGGGLVATDAGWRASHWQPGECLEYRADLRAIASERKPDVGWQLGDDLVAAPELWLLHPDLDGSAPARVDVSLPRGWSISAPWRDDAQGSAGTSAPAAAQTSRRFIVPPTPANWSAAVAIGRFAEEKISLPGGVLRLTILHGPNEAQRATLHAWFDRISRAILSAYGRLPLADVQVLMIPTQGRGNRGVLFGQSVRGQGNSLQLLVDASRPAADFDDDWMAVHELSHLMHPYLGDRGAWLAEGLATYYQNVLRARAGLLTAKQGWAELADGFGRGSRNAFDETLEDAAAHMHRTHAFQRVYWAGAAYWLTVDDDLRRESVGRLSLDDVLGRFRDCCLPAYHEWAPEEFVARLDALAASHVFERRYHEFAAQKQFPDWRRVFAGLGLDDEGVPIQGAAATNAARREDIMRPRTPH
ncbi:MAG: hypothetical protein ABI846_03670 [Rudaea sp.]